MIPSSRGTLSDFVQVNEEEDFFQLKLIILVDIDINAYDLYIKSHHTINLWVPPCEYLFFIQKRKLCFQTIFKNIKQK